MALPPAPVRVPSQCPHAPSVTSVTSDKSYHEIISGAVHRSLGIYLQLRKTPDISARRPSDEDCATSHLLKWGSLPPNEVGRIAQYVTKGGGIKEGKVMSLHRQCTCSFHASDQ